MRNIIIIVIIVVVNAILVGFVWYYTTPAPFIMQVVSRPSNPLGQSATIQSFAGQRCVFLVIVAEDEGLLQGSNGYGTAVNISATEPSRMAIVTVCPQLITSGQITEVIVIPSVTSVNETLILLITGERGGLIKKS